MSGDHKAGIAIVEDEVDLANIYTIIFEKRNIPIVFIAHDGMSAVSLFNKCVQKPDIIIMDHRLPIMTGIDATKEIIKSCPSTKIIFVSADEEIRDEALRSGAVKFIKKPASIKILNEAVDDILMNIK
jgi:two-component system chemotaxis response regulator CheY